MKVTLEKQIENLAIAVNEVFKEIREFKNEIRNEISGLKEYMDKRLDRLEMYVMGHENRIDVLEDKVRIINTKIGL